MSPTIAPSTPLVVEFQASQVIQGISYDTYIANEIANEQVLLSSIASCMVGITTDNINQLTVVSNGRRRMRRLVEDVKIQKEGNAVIRTLASSISVSYVIATSTPGLTYSSISNELQTSVSNGTFDNYLNFYGQQVSGGSDLVGCTSTTIDIVDVIDNDDDHSSNGGINVPLAIGLAIGLFALCICTTGVVYYYYFNSETTGTTDDGTTTSFRLTKNGLEKRSTFAGIPNKSDILAPSPPKVSIVQRPTTTSSKGDNETIWMENALRSSKVNRSKTKSNRAQYNVDGML